MRRKILIALASLSAAAASAAPSPGQTYFDRNCASCHTVDPNLSSRAGPGLYGVVGRKAGSVPGYNYTDAMVKAGAAGKTWTRAELDVFLADPTRAVPGTAMPVGVPGKADRAALVDYFANLSGKTAAPAASKAAAPAAKAGAWTEDKPGDLHHITVADLVAPFASESAGNGPKVAPRPSGTLPAVPPGFKVGIFAQDTEKGRLPLRAPNGDIFLSEPNKGQIRVLRSTNGETADQASVFATGLSRPYGMAFYPSGANPKYLYVANVNSIVRFAYKAGDLKASGEPEVVVASLSDTTGGHVTRTLAFSLDDRTMLVSIGSATNVATNIGPRPPQPLAQWERSMAPAPHGARRPTARWCWPSTRTGATAAPGPQACATAWACWCTRARAT
jgi:cytochrome c2